MENEVDGFHARLRRVSHQRRDYNDNFTMEPKKRNLEASVPQREEITQGEKLKGLTH